MIDSCTSKKPRSGHLVTLLLPAGGAVAHDGLFCSRVHLGGERSVQEERSPPEAAAPACTSSQVLTSPMTRVTSTGGARPKTYKDGELKYTETKQFSQKMNQVATFIKEAVLNTIGPDALGVPECCVERKVQVHKLLF